MPRSITTRRIQRPAAVGPVRVTLISDATGSLGKHVLDTLFTQFPPGAFVLQTLNFVNSKARLKECLAYLRKAEGLVIHATIYEEFKRRIEEVCHRRGLPVYDLTGPIVSFVVSASGRQPQVAYHRLHELSPGYFQRIAAIDYAIAHDDGGGLATLDQAEIVLTGISRTTKTPTSMVLATHGYRTANVPLVLGLDPPKELFAVDPRRVVCLTVDPRQLAAFRSKRVQERLAGFDHGYTDETIIRQELTLSQRLAQARGWHVVDVTGRAVEETAARIMQLVMTP